MKFKSLIMIVLLLFTLCSISAIHADTYMIKNSSFTLPDGYGISEQGPQTLLYNDKYVLTFFEGPQIGDDQIKDNLIANNYTFIGEDNYDFDGVNINQQNYNKNGVNTCVYSFEKNSHFYVITLNVYENQEVPEYENNPVTQIIDSLEVTG